jgi:putative redox protein
MATEVEATLIGGMQFALETGSGHTLVIDSDKPEVGGRNTGPRAFELMTASIAGCTAMDVISILRKMQQKVTDLKVSVRSEDVEEHPKRYRKVIIAYRVVGFGLQEAKVARAIELSETRYCPAMASVRTGLESIETRYEIVEADEPALLK